MITDAATPASSTPIPSAKRPEAQVRRSLNDYAMALG